MRVLPLLFALLLAGCGVTETRSLPRGAVPAVQEGEGILVIVFDNFDPVQRVRLDPDGRLGDAIDIIDLRRGVEVFVQVVRAGRYCISEFVVRGISVDAEDVAAICVEVDEGMINYGGHFAPRVARFSVVPITASFHVYDRLAFMELMRRDYRSMLDAYPVDARDFSGDVAEDF